MAGHQGGEKDPGDKGFSFDPTAADAYILRDPQAFAMNIARAVEHLGKAASEWLAPRERGDIPQTATSPLSDLFSTLSDVAEYWMAEPQRTLEAQTHLLSRYMAIWQASVARLAEAQGKAQAQHSQEDTAPKNRRFADADWQANPFFSVLQQVHGVTADWAQTMVSEAAGLDERTREKARFYMRQVTDAVSPANFAFTNPQVFRETVATSGGNLAEGMAQLARDMAAGQGMLRLRQTDHSRFAIGQNIAVTPGKVIARNDLCEIIQYAPSTPNTLARPLLIIPPWINKFYILDLNAQKSFVKWCVDQGHTVFMLSWVNPDRRHADKGWEHYLRDGIDFALTTIENATSERQVNAVGYCIGGTLLASALALHAQENDSRVSTATMLAAQTDFTHAGELKIFVDEAKLAALDAHMNAVGYLDGAIMAGVFNLLRASDLIWPYMVDNYLRGAQPPPFDLLYWNSDSTRVTAANHSFYLRNCYLENNLAKGRMVVGGKTLNLKDVTVPVYDLATRDDHIAPAESVFTGASLFGGPVDFVLGASGHIAGVVNPPEAGKYRYWTGASPSGDFEDWQKTATTHEGSWWPHWQSWIETHGRERVPARVPGDGSLVPLCDAPGSYVLE